MPSTRSTSRAAQPAALRTLRPLAHRLPENNNNNDHACARGNAPATQTKKPRQKLAGQRPSATLNSNDNNANVETSSIPAPAHNNNTKPLIKTREANVRTSTLSGITTSSTEVYAPFTIPAGILREPFIASGCRSPGSKFFEHIDDDVPCWTEPTLIDNEETTLTGPALTTTVAAGIKYLRNKTWSTVHILITTFAIIAMALVSIRNTYGFLSPTTVETLVHDEAITCETGLHIHAVTAASWDVFIADFTLVIANSQDDHFFSATQDEDGYDGGDEHDDDDDFPDDISEDSCLWIPEEGSHFLQYETTWDMMKLAAGITQIEDQLYRTPPPRQELQEDPDVQEFLAQMEADNQESGPEWSDDDEDSKQDPFNVPTNYDNADDWTLPRATKGLGNCREWYYEELDAPIPFPGYDSGLEPIELDFIDAGANEVVEVEDVWGYDGMEDERLVPIQGWTRPERPLFYMQELYPRRARFEVTYATDGQSDETSTEPESYDEERSFEEEIPEPPSYLWGSFNDE